MLQTAPTRINHWLQHRVIARGVWGRGVVRVSAQRELDAVLICVARDKKMYPSAGTEKKLLKVYFGTEFVPPL
jgi:hypothetical protein